MDKLVCEYLKGKRHSGITLHLMGVINSTCKRSGSLGNGIYSKATFDMDGVEYQMTKQGILYVKNGWTGMWEEVKAQACKRGAYMDYQISGLKIKVYHMTLLCLTDWFFDTYVSSSSFVVNHKEMSSIAVLEQCDVLGKLEFLNFLRDPRNLELVSIKLNNKHSGFIYRYGLYDMKISAFDVESLESELLDEIDSGISAGKSYRDFECVKRYVESGASVFQSVIESPKMVRREVKDSTNSIGMGVVCYA